MNILFIRSKYTFILVSFLILISFQCKQKTEVDQKTLLLGAVLAGQSQPYSQGCAGFWSYNYMNYRYECLQVTKVASGTHADVYIQYNLESLQKQLGYLSYKYSSIASTFDDTIYPKLTSIFGKPVDIDQSGKIIIFIKDINDAYNNRSASSYIGGFVNPADYFIDNPTKSYRSNQREMITLDGFYLLNATILSLLENKPNALYSTLAHEFQHLLRSPYELKFSNATSPVDPANLSSSASYDASWINEGTSEVASDIAGYGPQAKRMKCFIGDPSLASGSCMNGFIGKPLFQWGGSILNYSFSYAFMRYLYDNSGSNETDKNTFLNAVVTGTSERGDSISGLMNVFKRKSTLYDNAKLDSDSTTMFRKLYSGFIAHSMGYTAADTKLYLGDSTEISLKSVMETYAYPETLKTYLNYQSILPKSSGTIFEFYPSTVYRLSGDTSGTNATENSKVVYVKNGTTEHFVFNGSTTSSERITTKEVKQNTQMEDFQTLILSGNEKGSLCPHDHLKRLVFEKN
ncbi:MAG: hypothetical protein KDK54_22105 [Leptospiraceae bacterium]|nr:hypothetical protein [Leptospiraceae bacterium]